MKKHFLPILLLCAAFCQGQGWKEPPSGLDIMRWYFSDFPKTHNGWVVEKTDKLEAIGDFGFISSIVNVSCDTCGYLNKYSFDVWLDHGDGEANLRVTQNKDTTNKYFEIECHQESIVMVIHYRKLFFKYYDSMIKCKMELDESDRILNASKQRKKDINKWAKDQGRLITAYNYYIELMNKWSILGDTNVLSGYDIPFTEEENKKPEEISKP